MPERPVAIHRNLSTTVRFVCLGRAKRVTKKGAVCEKVSVTLCQYFLQHRCITSSTLLMERVRRNISEAGKQEKTSFLQRASTSAMSKQLLRGALILLEKKRGTETRHCTSPFDL